MHFYSLLSRLCISDGGIPPIDVGQFALILRRQPSEDFFFIYIVAINKLNNK